MLRAASIAESQYFPVFVSKLAANFPVNLVFKALTWIACLSIRGRFGLYFLRRFMQQPCLNDMHCRVKRINVMLWLDL